MTTVAEMELARATSTDTTSYGTTVLVPLLRQSGLETVAAVERHLRAALSEFLASPDLTCWPKAGHMGRALTMQDELESVLWRLETLHHEMEREAAGAAGEQGAE